MTRASIMVIFLLVVTTNASIEFFSPEVDNHFSHNYHSHAIDKIADSPILRSLLNNYTSSNDPRELKRSKPQVVKRGTASNGVWKPFDCPQLNCSEPVPSSPPSAGRLPEGQGTPLWVFVLGMLVMAILPLIKKTIVCLFNHWKLGRGRTLNNGPIVLNSATQVIPDIDDEEAVELPALPPLSPVPSVVLSNLPIPVPMLSASLSNINRTPLFMDGRRSSQVPTSAL